MPDSPQSNTLDLILGKLFDYAGMFPPAARSFEEALQEAAEHATSLKRPWMIGADLVLDTAHAKLLQTKDLNQYGFSDSIAIAILASEGLATAFQTATDIINNPRSDNKKISIAAIETKTTQELLSADIHALGAFADQIKSIGAIEPDLSKDNWRDLLSQTILEISQSPFSSQLALKCRSTGPTGIGAQKLAAAIFAVSDAQLSFKVTGGFHHPIVEPDHHQYPMGFLNLKVAILMRRALGSSFSEKDIEELLINDSPKALSFENGIKFKELAISAEQVIQASELASFSIGSCSIHEPDDDLGRLFLP
jgi:hypothetical protein